MIDFEITKKQKIKEVNNDMCHNYYYLIYGKIYNNDKTKIRKFKFIVWFDFFDLQEYYEKEIIKKEEIKIYVDDLIFNVVCSYIAKIKDFDDQKKLNEFYNYCNYTIQKYNDIT